MKRETTVTCVAGGFSTYRRPFDMLTDAAPERTDRRAAGTLPDGLSEVWLPIADVFRTLDMVVTLGE